MSLNKEKGFLVGLGVGTVVVAGALAALAMNASSRYEAAKEAYVNATGDVEKLGKSDLYPTQANLNAKRKSVEDYRKSVASLQESLLAFKPKELKPTAPGEFTKQIQDASQESRMQLTEAKVEVPEKYALGFESYTSDPVKESATPLLGYQLGAHRALFKMLADARPSKLINVFRERQPEEDGKPYPPVALDPKTNKPSTAPAKKEPYRALPMELSFKGSERSLREFLSALSASKDYYYVVRSVRITNEKKEGPKKSDATFDEQTASNPFGGGGFTLPPEGAAAPAPAPAPAEGAAAAAPAEGAAAVAAAEPATPADSSQILKQVLGNEQINCFLRIDVIMFNEGVELPKVQ